MNDKIIAILGICLLVAWIGWLAPSEAGKLGDIAVGAIAGMASGQLLTGPQRGKEGDE